MPDPALLTPLGKAMLGSLPPRVRGSIDYLAVIHAAAREVELLEASIETVRAQFNPATADVLLDAWEAMLRLPVGGPAGASIAARRALVMARLRKLVTTGEGREWEEAIDAIVGAGSWSYLEHDPNPLTNAAPNPGFEHDAVGAAPAGWVSASGLAAVGVSRFWAASGVQSLELYTTPQTAAGQPSYFMAGPDAGPGAQSALLGWNASRVRTGQLAGRYAANIASLGGGTWEPYLEVWCYDGAGNFLVALSLTAPTLRNTTGVFTPTGLATLPVGCAWFRVSISLYCATAGTLDFYLDSVGVYFDPPGGVVPAWTSGDSPGWAWLGTAGNSPSQLVTPPDGEVTITLPYPPGASQFIDASNQIRDITDAHLVLNFASAVVFRLDTDPQDSTQFGA